MDGLQVLEELRKTENSPEAIVLTAYASIDRAVKATKLGAFDFVAKPFKNDELLLVVKNAMEHHRLVAENQRLKDSLRERYSFQNIIGKSAAMQQVYDLIAQVAPRRSTVLIQGESGTGKELVAKRFTRPVEADAPLSRNSAIYPDCWKAAFGHVRGAYTGATSAKKGCSRLPTAEPSSRMIATISWKSGQTPSSYSGREFRGRGLKHQSGRAHHRSYKPDF
jgi:DNA-binding NtrC family response regulator